MPNAIKWDQSASFTSRITTGLDSLADGSGVDSSAVDNATDLDQYIDVSLILGSSNPSGSPFWEIHILPRLGDGSSYADPNAGTLVGTIPVDIGSSTKEGMLRRVEIPPGHYKIRAVNRMGVANAASGNTLSTRPLNDEVQ